MKAHTINLKLLAQRIAVREGLEKLASVAQISVAIKHALDLLAEESDATVLKLLQRRRNRGER